MKGTQPSNLGKRKGKKRNTIYSETNSTLQIRYYKYISNLCDDTYQMLQLTEPPNRTHGRRDSF